MQSLNQKMLQQDSKEKITDYGDHYELCFDQSRNLAQSNFISFKHINSSQLNFHIWVSLATVIHGISSGNLSFSDDYVTLLGLYDQITNSEKKKEKTSQSATIDVTKSFKNSKSSKSKSKSTSKRFNRFFRLSKSRLNVISEGDSQEDKPTLISSACTPPVSNENDNSGTKDVQLSILETTKQNIGQLNLIKSSEETPCLTSSTKKFLNSNVLATLHQSTIFESHPHLLPHLYQIECETFNMVPSELIQKLLKYYSEWLHNRLKVMLVELKEKVVSASKVRSTSNLASISKSITKLLSSKSSCNSSNDCDAKFSKENAYVEMNYPLITSKTLSISTNTEPHAIASLPFSDDTFSLNSWTNFSSSTSNNPTNDKLSKPKLFSEEIIKIQWFLDQLEHNMLNLNSNRFLLKICGYEEYLLGDRSLLTFEVICIAL